MLRVDALQFLNSQPAFRAFVADTGIGVEDNPAGWTSVIDATFRALGLATTGEVIATKEQDARLLLRYYALEQFADLYSLRVDLNLSTVGFDKKKSQAYNAIAERLKAARAAVEALGYVPSAGSVSIGRLTLDFLEPVTLEY